MTFLENSDLNDMVTCLGGCQDACGDMPPNVTASTLFSMCELYCACMDHNCPGSVTAGAGSACVASCMGADPSLTYCRKMHCEFISLGGQSITHCPHAVGVGQCETPPAPNDSCDDIYDGLPCTRDSECCSGECIGEVCGG
jgi:hypothetical protein